MLLAVHLSDVLTWPWCSCGFGAAALLVAWGLHDVTDREVSRLGVMAAAFFVGSQIHLPVGVGSVHLLLNGVAGVVLGRRVGVALAVGLTLQALLFAHGGLTTLGVNITAYTLPALAAGRIIRPLMRRLTGFAAGVLVGGGTALATVLMSSAALALGGEPGVRGAAPAILAVNLPLVGVEAVAVGFVVAYLAKARPEWLGGERPA